jgi:hypothetical protein
MSSDFSLRLPMACLCVIFAISSDTAHAKDCRKIEAVKQRMDCIEGRIDEVSKRIDNLPTKPGIGTVLIRSTTRRKGSQCLTWQDNAKAPVTLSCDHDDQKWDLIPRKK